MPYRRILVLRVFFFLACLALAGQSVRWQWMDAPGLARAACRQRLAIQALLSWPRGDFLDRDGRPLTNPDWHNPGWYAPSSAQPGGAAARRYGRRPLAVHLLGYVNPGDGQGAAGLERSCEEWLAGGAVPAVARIVDGRRRPLGGLGARLVRAPAAGGADVLLTIDRRLQAAVERIADRHLPRGAIVVLSPWTGEILAMTSRPCFDPRRPGAGLRAAGAPFLNRALTAYHPGSIFKLVTLAAALEKDPTVFGRLFADPGRVDCGPLTFHCPGRGHGLLTLADALAFSCNTTFIRLALELGMPTLIRTAEKLGLGLPACLDLPGEALGDLPSAADRSPGSLANTALGQGMVTATPLQVARMVGAVANGGYLVPGRVLRGLVDGGGKVRTFSGNEAPVRAMTARTAHLISAMMAGVIRYGTGRAAAVPGGAAGKTGTAQTGIVDPDGKRHDHAWFAGFAPLSRPRFVVVVLAEGGGAGGAAAAPVFRLVMEAALGGTGTKQVKGTYAS